MSLESHSRRSRNSLRSALSTDTRSKPHRRGLHLFSRPSREDGEPLHRRSFLAKPPVPGAARRVLTVLHSPSPKPKKPSRPTHDVLSGSGYDDAAGSESRPGRHDILLAGPFAEARVAAASVCTRSDSLASSVGGVEASASSFSDSTGSARRLGISQPYISDTAPVPAAPISGCACRALRERTSRLTDALASVREELAAMQERAERAELEAADAVRAGKEARRRLARRVREVEERAALRERAFRSEMARMADDPAAQRHDVDAGGRRAFGRSESARVGDRRPRVDAPAPQLPTPVMERARSVGNVHEARRRGREPPAGSIRRSTSTASGPGSARSAARRSLLRRALVAHVHSVRYTSAAAAWERFFSGEGGVVSPEQFARAVRGLAVAADARDKDVDALRVEVCGGVETGDTGGVTWPMFVRFYGRTRGEST